MAAPQQCDAILIFAVSRRYDKDYFLPVPNKELPLIKLEGLCR